MDGDSDEAYVTVLRSVQQSVLGTLDRLSAVMREAQVQCGDKTAWVPKALLDTGAERGNYIGAAMVERLGCTEFDPCRHRVRLGDGDTCVEINRKLTLEVSLYNKKGELGEPVATEFYVMPSLGEEIIIGLPDILGNYYEIFMGMMKEARKKLPRERLDRLYDILEFCQDELGERQPDVKLLKRFAKEAAAIRAWYTNHKRRVVSEPRDGLSPRPVGAASCELP